MRDLNNLNKEHDKKLKEIKNKLLKYYLDCGTKMEYQNTKKFLKEATRKEILELCEDCALFDI